jgi:23S rRNA (uracil1939-C5)-methyltransferase
VIFVPRGRRGDRLRVRVESVRAGYARALTEAVLQHAAEARTPPCGLFVQCGGCAYQHVDYEAQLRVKEDILRESLGRAGVIWDAPIPVQPSPEEGWRTRAAFHVQQAGGAIRLGLHAEGTHRVIDLGRCLQISAAMNRTQRAVARALGERPHRQLQVTRVDMAESIDGAQVVVALETDGNVREAASLASLKDTAPWLTGLGVVARSGRARQFVPLFGSPSVDSTVAGVRLRAHVRSFFQANRFLVEPLALTVADLLPPGGTVLDLYAGVGLFALTVAPRADVVHGIEVNPTAAKDAADNARRAGLRRVRIAQADVRQGLASLAPVADERIILDPPRTGAEPGVVQAIASREPAAVVYVSCDPPTLGRDLRLFAGLGYRLDGLRAFDMFPDTHHLETVARLARV